MFNIHNVSVYVNNNSPVDLENCTIQHNGNGGHPIKLRTIKSMGKTEEEMCIITARERSELIFSYSLNGKNYSLSLYDKIFLTDLSPIIINITSEDNKLIFTTERKSVKNI
ncbi:MAG: hypothetical protein HUJ77_01485 [Clostridium sp.]|uniref:hypothetical protein n=1 Tax=Clostridium sp. TaxID=1506 RepID=UPI0025C39C93|nr:hypothetical protein [Clostridium sp.]MCF0147049.1 hypothetical protein [Clostridium sp.]